ncbi:MAG TPA: undecaprenyl-diphosphate phosphatase [Candidatus Baltobacteraceae bacterium]
MTFAQALVLALLQGVSELFPVSSLGHTILVPALFQWNNIDRTAPTFLAFVVVLHLGTAIALVLFYWKDWVNIVGALLRSVARGKLSDDRDERIGWLLVVGTIPVGLLGLLFQEKVQGLFGAVAPAAVFLVINGFIMFFGEALRKRQHADSARSYKRLEAISWMQSVFVGFAQSLALFPGISRSGASIVGGLLIDLDHEDAAKYSFLLATPVILAASLLKIPELFAPGAHVALVQAIVGGVLSGVAAYLSVAFLTRYFRSNDLRPFGWYCVLFGALCFVLARMGVIR